MRLAHLATNSIIISRLQTVSGDKMALSTVTAGLVTIQPVGTVKTEAVNGVFGKTYRIFADIEIDIKEGDHIRDEDTGNIYTVMNGGITERNYGFSSYQEVFMQKIN